MNGSDNLLNALWDGGIRVCFANPGTSEMTPGCRTGPATGDTSGSRPLRGCMYGCGGRLRTHVGQTGSDASAAGPGLANGLSNLHNAMRAQSQIVNIVELASIDEDLDAAIRALAELVVTDKREIRRASLWRATAAACTCLKPFGQWLESPWMS
jgi:acetolactate synthase I/II/III large subunit